MYFLRLPFTLPPDQKIKVDGRFGRVGRFLMALGSWNSCYVLIMGGFPSEDAARNYFDRAQAGLTWVTLQLGITPRLRANLRDVLYTESGCPTVEELFMVSKTAIGGPMVPLVEESRAETFSSNGAHTAPRKQTTSGVPIPAEQILHVFAEGITFPNARRALAEPNLRLATELFASHFTAASPRKRFLVLMTSFEALATKVSKAQLVRDLLSKWLLEADHATVVAPESDDEELLKAIRRALVCGKEKAMRSQIETLVHSTLAVHGDLAARAAATRIGQVCEVLDTLVYAGNVDPAVLKRSILEAKSILEQVLRARFASVGRVP